MTSDPSAVPRPLSSYSVVSVDQVRARGAETSLTTCSSRRPSIAQLITSRKDTPTHRLSPGHTVTSLEGSLTQSQPVCLTIDQKRLKVGQLPGSVPGNRKC